jgi:hypothetical protein
MSDYEKKRSGLVATCVLIAAIGALFLLGGGGPTQAASQTPGVELGPGQTGQGLEGQNLPYIRTLTNTLYMPFAMKHWPPYPYSTTLNPIDNTDGDGIYVVGWLPAELAQTYSLEEDDNAAFSSPTEVYSGTGTSWAVPAPGRTAGTFYYRVRGHNTWGYGPYSNVRAVLVLLPVTPVLSPINNTDGDASYTVSWSAAARASSYTLQEDTDRNFGSPVTAFQGAQTTWSASGKAPATYYYRVRANGPTGQSAWSNVQSATVGAFRADRVDMAAGECTTLRWDFSGIKALYISFGYGYDLEGVVGHGTGQVCPSVTTTYQALVVKLDGSHERHYVTINVTGSGCGDPIIWRFSPTTYQVAPGQPFSIFWDVDCAKTVHFIQGSGAEEPVAGHGSKIDVRIYSDTLFKLKVGKLSGDFVYASFTVRVTTTAGEEPANGP